MEILIMVNNLFLQIVDNNMLNMIMFFIILKIMIHFIMDIINLIFNKLDVYHNLLNYYMLLNS